MRFRRLPGKSTQGIDISPLIDMVFILLIFFMVSTTFNKDMKLDIQRPNASSSVVASSKTIRVHIDRQRDIYVDKQPTKLWVLRGKVRDLLRGVKDKTVLVVTDNQVPSQRLVEVVDQIRLAGATNVGVATSAEAGI